MFPVIPPPSFLSYTSVNSSLFASPTPLHSLFSSIPTLFLPYHTILSFSFSSLSLLVFFTHLYLFFRPPPPPLIPSLPCNPLIPPSTHSLVHHHHHHRHHLHHLHAISSRSLLPFYLARSDIIITLGGDRLTLSAALSIALVPVIDMACAGGGDGSAGAGADGKGPGGGGVVGEKWCVFFVALWCGVVWWGVKERNV